LKHTDYNQNISHTPTLGLTLGDPAGIGPEIACKALADKRVQSRVIIIGDAFAVQNACRQNNSAMDIHILTDSGDFKDGKINVLDMRILDPGSFEIGKVQKSCGFASFKYIEKSIELALAKKIDAVVTNPINKEAMHLAGFDYPGHTEIFAEKCGIEEFSMLFLLKNVGVAHVTTHCSLRNAISLIKTDRVVATIKLLNNAMKELGVKSPRIAVGGLNPHAGEGGLFGDEEICEINPAIDICKKAGITISGPYPPDTVFMRAFKGEFDGIVAMLHDHGFVALKSLDFEHGVNITIGLPIIRTSVGHGTAFIIAGKGVASHESLVDAINAAERICRARRINTNT
jgi:4-hydroxythreonine-4-phosphate dehydrogenase